MMEMPPKIQNDESIDYVNQLKKELEVVESKNRDFNSKQIINENKLKEAKQKVIGQLFEMMKDMGVDPNDLESINVFLKKLENQDPDLLILFEAIFKNITGDTGEEAPLSAPEMPIPPSESEIPPVPIRDSGEPVPPLRDEGGSGPLKEEQSISSPT